MLFLKKALFTPCEQLSPAAGDSSPLQRHLGMVEDIGYVALQVRPSANDIRCSADMARRSDIEEDDRSVLALQDCVLGHTGRAV
jgi:hypothetical protein